MSKPDPTFRAHYISGTHWDREWYRPFQEFRYLLVDLVDRLLHLMETDPAFRYFQLDGQTCMLEDYVEIRPENRERLQALMQQGRILAGPWFTMPDLFCAGDEALVRNLQLGRRICRAWGVDPMPVGFICDMFGHPSQMPQLFAGFGIGDALLGRGTNEDTTPMYFRWEAPDGTGVFTFKLQDGMGYGAFAHPRAMLENPDFPPDALPDHRAEIEAAQGDEARIRPFREQAFRQALAGYVNHEMERATGPVLCLMDSMDHILPATEVERYLRLIVETAPNVTPVHSNLPAFFRDARASLSDVPARRGELREPSRRRSGYLWLIPYCVSSRVRMKQANDTCQNLLEKWAEPLLAVAACEGAALPPAFLQTAWKHVLTNHAHDSICGCSIDQVHRDMMYRFDQARLLAEQLRSQAVARLTEGCADLARGKDEFTVTVVNPLPFRREETVVFDVDLPTDYPHTFREGFSGETLRAFRLEDADGNPVPYQRLALEPDVVERSRYARFCFHNNGAFDRYRVAARLDLPGLGFTSLRVVPSPQPVRAPGSLRTGPTAAENEHLAVAMENNGTLAITDKASGQTYTGLLLVEDRADVGDGWFFGPTVNDEQILSSAGPAQVSVEHDGPEVVTFLARLNLSVPAAYDPKARRRSARRVPLVVTHRVSLRRGARTVEVETRIDNTAEDHRLRLLLPTDAAGATTYLAHHPYDLVERPITLDPDTFEGQEAEVQEKPFLFLQAVGDGDRGLAVLAPAGLHEGGVVDDRRRTLAVTLFRSYRATVSTSGEEDGLERGELRLRYALAPFAGELPAAELLREVARLQAGVFTRQTGPRPSGFPPMAGDGHPAAGFLEQETGRLVVSAVKPPENGSGLVVRLWNPGDERATEALRFRRRVGSARICNLAEEPQDQEAEIDGSVVTVEAGPHKIVTLHVEFN